MNSLITDRRFVAAPAGYEPSLARWLWALEDTRQRTKHSLEGLTDEIVDWMPPEGGNSIGALLYHIVVIEMSWLYEEILEVQEYPKELEPLLLYEVREENGRLTPVQGESLEAHLSRLDAGRALFLEGLKGMTAEDFQRLRRLEDYEVTPEWALHHLMQHEAEHRGQILEIRRRAEDAMNKY
jgi:uncharacterized damage-inducible protein DinB